MRVLVLGAGGMLGHVVTWILKATSGIECIGLTRDQFSVGDKLDLTDCLYIVNCIGVIKPKIYEDDVDSVKNAYRVNSWFPKQLARQAFMGGVRIITIATDCVYDGSTVGGYFEDDDHDATDIYGRSKSLGEVEHDSVRTLRCSIVGPELGTSYSLLSWFLKSHEETLHGFANHNWNGLTTLAFAKVVRGMITEDMWHEMPHLVHLVPKNIISKCELLETFKRHYGKGVDIIPGAGPTVVNRALWTQYPVANRILWGDSGYGKAPAIGEMVAELATWKPPT
jgi:dTDP-4-dehydrorhamnose reductase